MGRRWTAVAGAVVLSIFAFAGCDKDKDAGETETPGEARAADEAVTAKPVEAAPTPGAARPAAPAEPRELTETWQPIWQSDGVVVAPLVWTAADRELITVEQESDDGGLFVVGVRIAGETVLRCSEIDRAGGGAVDAKADRDFAHVRCRGFAHAGEPGWSEGARLRWRPAEGRAVADGTWEAEGDDGDPDTMDFDEQE